MVRGCLAILCYRCRRLSFYGWWPPAVAGRVSEFDVYSRRVRTYFVYVIKPPCHSVEIYECIPGIYVITRVIRVLSVTDMGFRIYTTQHG